jgi:hypothetical protein
MLSHWGCLNPNTKSWPIGQDFFAFVKDEKPPAGQPKPSYVHLTSKRQNQCWREANGIKPFFEIIFLLDNQWVIEYKALLNCSYCKQYLVLQSTCLTFVPSNT